jgi:hypothetical protein
MREQPGKTRPQITPITQIQAEALQGVYDVLRNLFNLRNLRILFLEPVKA